jgi:predicted enzyme related to lactoylglutathione lyase
MSVRGKDRQIDNIELNVGDIARSKAFYGSAFGWTFVDYGPTYTEFTDGRLTGGFTTGEPVRPGGPLIILYADNLAETQRRLIALGAVLTRVAAGSTSRIQMAMNWPCGQSSNKTNPSKELNCHGPTG